MTAPIVVESLTKRFGSFTAVRDVSFDVQRGEIFGYLGANGAGKSTTIRMLCGLLRPSSGRAAVAGFDVGRAPRAVQTQIGYMSQKFSLYLDLPVAANLEFFAGAYRVRDAPRRTTELVDRLDLGGILDQRTGDLPGGTRQRLALACALLHAPPIVFLDEPTAGVDPEARRTFWKLIQELSDAGTTVFVTTHYLDEAEGCHRVGLMVDGELAVLDTPDRLKARHVPGAMLSVRTHDLKSLAGALDALPAVRQVQTFGRALHVELQPGGTIPTPWFSEHDPRAEVERIQPTLEDVFLRVVEGYGREANG